jgi:hypothetical protein
MGFSRAAQTEKDTDKLASCYWCHWITPSRLLARSRDRVASDGTSGDSRGCHLSGGTLLASCLPPLRREPYDLHKGCYMHAHYTMPDRQETARVLDDECVSWLGTLTSPSSRVQWRRVTNNLSWPNAGGRYRCHAQELAMESCSEVFCPWSGTD